MAIEETVLARITPPRTDGLVERSLTDEAAAEARTRNLLLVVAGPGYGKTSLLAALAARAQRAAWLGLTAAERDPEGFLYYLSRALSSAQASGAGANGPATGPAPAPARGERGLRAATLRLVSWLADAVTEPVLLLLDDYHLVSGVPAVDDIMQCWLENLPPQVHVAVGSRSLPDWPLLPRWLASGWAAVIGEERLRFDLREAAALLHAQYGLRPGKGTLQQLLALTEGWPLGLQLFGHVLRRRSGRRQAGPGARPPEAPDAPPAPLLPLLADDGQMETISRQALFDYFSAAVLRQHGPAVRSFLTGAAVLETITPTACNAILGRRDAHRMLRSLARQGLFLSRIGPDTWRFHSLFRTFLLQQLQAESDRYRGLQVAAATYFGAAGQHEAAVPHWLAAADYDQAATAVHRAAGPLCQAGRGATVSHWLEQFPPDRLERYPDLLYWQGYLLESRGHWQQALAWYDRAEAGYRQAGSAAGQVAILRRRAQIAAWWERKHGKVRRYARAALKLLAQEPVAGAGDHLRDLAESCMLPGELDRARRLCQQAVTAYRAEGNPAAAARALVRPGSWIEFMAGNFDTAVNLLELAAATTDPRADVWLECERLTALAGNLVFLYGIEACRATGEQALRLAEQCDSVLFRAMNHRTLAMAWQLGAGADLGLARHHVDQALSLGAEIDDVHVLVTAAYIKLLLEHRSGDRHALQAALAECRRHAQRYGDYWLAAHALANMALVVAPTRPSRAASLLQRALNIALKQGDQYGEGLARLGLAIVTRDVPERLREHLPGAVVGVSRYGRGLLLGDFTAQVEQLLVAARRAALPAAELSALVAAPSAPARVTVRLFGGFAVTVDGAAVPDAAWRQSRAREVLKLLAARGRVPREWARTVFWTHLSDRAADNNLYISLHQIRQVLDPAQKFPRDRYVRLEAGTVRLTDAAQVDTRVFLQHVERARGLLATGDPAGARTELLAAAEIGREPFLPEDPYAEWARETRRHLQDQQVWVRETLAQLAARDGNYTEACLYLRELLTMEPTHESAHRSLIEYLHLSGRPGEARRQYQRCRRILRQELGVVPAAETVALARRLFGAQKP